MRPVTSSRVVCKASAYNFDASSRNLPNRAARLSLSAARRWARVCACCVTHEVVNEARPPIAVPASAAKADMYEESIGRSNVASGRRQALRRRRECDRGLGGEHEESERLLKIEAHRAVRVAQIADRDVLPDMQVEIAAPRGEHASAVDGRRPDYVVLDELLDMLQHRVAVVDGLRERGIGVGPEHDRIG